MDDIEYFTCECVYHQHGYILCATCANIFGIHESVFLKRWNRYKRREPKEPNDSQQTESKEFN